MKQLFAPERKKIFLEALELAHGLEPTSKNIERITLRTDADAAQWAFTQWNLRERARSKFTNPENMLFDRIALEQASHEQIAYFHASQFPKGDLVLDLTTGIGSDLMALLGRGPSIGFEIDPAIAFYAEYNSHAEIRRINCMSAKWDADYIFADPSRRGSRGERVGISGYSPNPNKLAERMKNHKKSCIKLSPMLRNEELFEIGKHVRFLSFQNECKEADIWIGGDLEPGIFATDVESGLTIRPSENCHSVKVIEDFIYEANPAAIRAGCLGTLCNDLKVSEIADTNGYLTGKDFIASPWVSSYRVTDFGTFHERQLKDLGPVSVIKTRKVNHKPESLIKKSTFAPDGKILFLFAIERSIKFVLAQRL